MDNQFQDAELTCVECEQFFLWTVGEQQFLNKLVTEGKIDALTQPKRCPACRLQRKKNRNF